MRILWVNTYEYPSNLNADSSLVLTVSIIENLCAVRDDLFFYVTVPKRKVHDRRFRWRPYTLPQHPRIHWIEVPTATARALNEAQLSDEMFRAINPFNGDWCTYDAIICNNAGKALQMKIWAELIGDVQPPVYLWDYNTRSDKSIEVGGGSSLDAAMGLNLVGYTKITKTFFFTPWAKKSLMQTARRWLSPSKILELSQKSLVVPTAVNTLQLDKHLSSTKYRKTSLYFGGRFTGSKGAERVADIASKMFRSGKDIEIHITTPSKNTRKVLKVKEAYPELIFHFGLSQTEAWEVMSRCHIGVYGQSVCMMPAAPFEQMYAGLPVLIPRAKSEGILPEGYPWSYKDDAEMFAKLKLLLGDFDRYSQEFEKYRQVVADVNSVQTTALSVLAQIEQDVAKNKKKLKSVKVRKLLPSQETIKTMKSLGADSWAQVREIVQEYNSNLALVAQMSSGMGKRKSFWRLHQELTVWAEELDLDKAIPRYRF
jgi:glycosyltransferase involved in cell wall biosynthesis